MYSKILFINPFGIGDVLFTTPIIHTLKDFSPRVKLGYLCNSRTKELIKNNPFIDYVFVYDRDEFEGVRRSSFLAWIKKWREFIEQIRKERFDLVLDFSLSRQFGFLSWFAGIKNRVGFNFRKRGIFLTQKINLEGYHDKHIAEYYGELLDCLGLNFKYKGLELYLEKEDLKTAGLILANCGLKETDLLVGLVPGAGRSWGPDAYLKHWPAKNFGALADKLVENYQAKIIILGDFAEKSIAKEICDNMRNIAFDLTGKTRLGELAAILSRVKLLVANDGGPLHMAVALGIKTVSIFGPVDERVYGPYPPSNQHVVVTNSEIYCRPCYENFRYKNCAYNRRCTEDIEVDKVFASARRLI